MFARYTINIDTLASGTTATTYNIPINMEFQTVDQAELVDRVFVSVETENSINPIIDYEKVRFLPLDVNGNNIDSVTYTLNISGQTTYGGIGFTDDDIKFRKEVFKQTFLNLNFYDSDNPTTQQLVSNIKLFAQLSSNNLYGFNTSNPGTVKPANQITLQYTLENPIFNPRGFSEGYHLYGYKDELNIGDSKYLYMRASFKNAKNGRSTNLMVVDTAQPIDMLIHELYTRYKLVRRNDGYYYEIDDTYHGNTGGTITNNVTYTLNPTINSVNVSLYQIKAL